MLYFILPIHWSHRRSHRNCRILKIFPLDGMLFTHNVQYSKVVKFSKEKFQTRFKVVTHSLKNVFLLVISNSHTWDTCIYLPEIPLHFSYQTCIKPLCVLIFFHTLRLHLRLTCTPKDWAENWTSALPYSKTVPLVKTIQPTEDSWGKKA